MLLLILLKYACKKSVNQISIICIFYIRQLAKIYPELGKGYETCDRLFLHSYSQSINVFEANLSK